jgi:2-oxoglutarate ferredoxin oxidoreductase subunit delta
MEKAEQKESLRVDITHEWCKGCAICVDLCPKGALSLDSQQKAQWAEPDKCVRCGMCELRCPDLAIELIAGE